MGINKYWVAQNGRFSDSHWSETSGGPEGAEIPDSSSIVHFDKYSGNCIIDSTPTISSLNLNFDYTNTLTYISPIYTKKLNLSGGYLTTPSSAQIYLSEDASCLTGFGNYSSWNNALIVADGSGIQYITTGGIFPTLIVDKSTANPIKLVGSAPFYMNGDLIVKDGTFDSNNHDIILNGTLPFLPPLIVDFTWGFLPEAPTDLTATAVSSSEIYLNWKDNADNETGFKIERSLDGTIFSQIALTGADTTSYDNTGLNSETTYWYKIRAYNNTGDSSYSNIAYATTFPSETLDRIMDFVANKNKNYLIGIRGYDGIHNNGNEIWVSTINEHNWIKQYTTDDQLRGIYGWNPVVAVGNNGAIYVANGNDYTNMIWNSRISPTSYPLNKVTYAQSTWIAVGEQTDNLSNSPIVTSSDTTTWTLRDSGVMDPITCVNQVYIRNNSTPLTPRALAVAGADGTSKKILISSDCTTWSIIATLPEPNMITDIGTVDTTYLPPYFIEIGLSVILVGKGGVIYISHDYTNWTNVSTDNTTDLYSICYLQGPAYE